MSYRVDFYKDKQKFSAAHFTLFNDGELERLHGHNYTVQVALRGSQLQRGLLFPFHDVKPLINRLCDAWDEYVLLPAESDWVRLTEKGGQIEVEVTTPKHRKFYSFPHQDVVLLPCDNVSCENLAMLMTRRLVQAFKEKDLSITEVEIILGESKGQTVTFGSKL